MASLRVSLYADDAAIFPVPSASDVTNLAITLQHFGTVTGLVTNVTKSSISPIRCSDLDLDVILADFHATRASFPIKYLGMPLSLGKLRRADMQPYIDKVASCLQPWKGKFINRVGCTTLVKSVLTSLRIFLLTAIKTDKRTLKAFDKLRRGMLWNNSETASGGKCKVCRPKKLGGLESLNLEKFSRSLIRLRWLCHEWASDDKPWVGTETPNDDVDRNLFNVATKVTLGDGEKASFWGSSWLDGIPPRAIAPDLYEVSRRKMRCVRDALTDHKWITDLNIANFTADHIAQYDHLSGLIQDITLAPGTEDSITWTLTTNGIYTTNSAYKAQFIGASS